MAGSSVATPAAAGWVTDFLNAAYYARPEAERDVADIRLAHGIITTYWHGRRGRLGARHVLPLHGAYGRLRVKRRGLLDRPALLQGAGELIGDWFPDAWSADERRAHGIAFETTAARGAFAPEERLARAALRALTPPQQMMAQQHWATYDPVALPDAEAALTFLLDPARWPDMGCANGRFTAVRGGARRGQTFEIEVAADQVPRAPVFTRGYVTCTEVHTAADQPGLIAAVADVCEGYRAGTDSSAREPLPPKAQPLALIVLTTHEGHFLGRAKSHLLVWRDKDGTWIRDIGAWDPLPLHLAAAYAAAGKEAQQEFWGAEPTERSMLAQLALVA